ncbi:MAG TPA: rhomboid family intramembrane serine protease [Verrucomicrobiae bacterium]
MLEDRSYMRRTPFSPRRSVTLTLVLVNVAVFFLQIGLTQFTTFPTEYYCALSLEGLTHGYLWQLLTYQFMHAGVVHIFFNCWAIYLFGRDVEEALGRNSFVALYLLSGVIGGLVQILAGLLLGGLFAASVVGASAAAFGLCAAFAMLFPDRIILLFFVLPVRAKYLLVGAVVLALLGTLRPGDGVAHAAHLGGILTGLGFTRYASHWDWHWPRWQRRRTPSRRLVKVTSITGGLWGKTRTAADEDLPPEEFLSREVDPILDKISAQGIQSLTARERRILEAARQKMAKH